jgi:glycosyltransferase involved in cell wall biosynthesis
MRASVIVITRNRSHSIAETLEALSRQDHPDFEVLVIDSSDGDEKERTAKLAAQFGAKHVHEPRRGQALARNTGIPLATGEVIAFTDDDCIPAKDWLAKNVQNFFDPAIWACTGRVVKHNDGEVSQLFEEVAGQDLGGERRVFTRADIQFGVGVLLANATKVFAKHMKSSAPAPWCLGHGSSMAFRRRVFEQYGGFDQRFGWGCPFGGCEDIEVLYRPLKAGHATVYEPSAVVQQNHRFTAEEVFRTRYVYSYAGAGFMKAHRKDALMVFMFYGRLLQLLIKSAQYKLLGDGKLAQSFGSDLRGFLDGWTAYRKYVRENRSTWASPATPAIPPVTARSDGRETSTAH